LSESYRIYKRTDISATKKTVGISKKLSEVERSLYVVERKQEGEGKAIRSGQEYG
jgi:hypothetical protein